MNLFERRRLSQGYEKGNKANTSQPAIFMDEPSASPNSISSYAFAYSTIEAVRRGVDLVTDLSSEITYDVKEPLNKVGKVPKNRMTPDRLNRLLNISPNVDEDISIFKRNLVMDIVLAGNAFIYYDGASMYRLPAEHMTVHAGKKVKVAYYEYRPSGQRYSISEIIHIQDNSPNSNIVGRSRLISARNSITTLYEMLGFQQNFFKNGAVPGLILTTPNILGKKIKERLLTYWQTTYSPKTGGKKPLILDGDFKVQSITNSTFKELDFEISVEKAEDKILTAIGIPPILLKGGNNANIRPNMQLMYYTTVLPVLHKILAGLEAFFGYDLALDTSKVESLQPELQQKSAYQTSLVNAGIITINEARVALRFEESEDPVANELRIPANIAGSAANPSEGGRPPNEEP